MLTVNRLGLSAQLCRCLCSTNIIESPHMECACARGESAAGAMGGWYCVGRAAAFPDYREKFGEFKATVISGC
jgi:hypothetical protein